MGECDESDDYRDLYGDVELHLSSAITAIQAVSQLHVEDDGVYDNDHRNVGNFEKAEVEEVICGGSNIREGEENLEEEGTVEQEEDENGSETDDDFDILLNDDGDYDNNNFNINGTGNVRDKSLHRETDGKVGIDDDDEYVVKAAENRGNLGVENGGGSGGKGGFSGGSYNLQYNYAGYNSTTFSAQVASCLPTFVRDDWESSGCTSKYEKNCIRPQSRRNFSLPQSRTILDINIDTLENKPWRNSGVDITDFFNFGFNEDSWKGYCNHLDSHRNRTGNITGSAVYKDDRHRKEHGAEVDHDYQRLSLTSEISCRLPESQMLKGRAIEVENGWGERRPSIDVWLPVHRDADVVIEIPVQDLEEDHSNSDNVPFNGMTNYFNKASGNQEVGVDDNGDILYSSTSEDEVPILEGPTQKSNPRRHTYKDDCDPPLHLNSDSCESLHGSRSNEEEVQATKGVSDGLDEGISSDEPEKSDGKGMPATKPKKKSESSDSHQHHCSSPSQSDYIGSKDSAYSDPNKFHNHPKVVSQTSASELWESSKDSTNCIVCMKSDYKYVARSRSPVQRNMRFRQRRSSLKNHLESEYPLHMSDEDFCDGHDRAVDFHKERRRHHDFNSCRDKNYLYHEGLTYQEARFFSKNGSDFSGYSRGKDNVYRYKRLRYTGGNVKGKQPFPEQKTQRFGDEVMQRKWSHRERIYVREMDSSNYDVSGQLITEDAPYLYNGDHIQSKRIANEIYINGRIESDEFSDEHNYDNKFAKERSQPISDNWRYRNYLERRHERESSYTRGEAKNTLMNTRRCGTPFHDHGDIWHSNFEDNSSRYDRNRLYFHPYGEPECVFRGQTRADSLARNGMIGRHGRQKRQNCVERYRGSNKLDDYVGGHNIQHTYDHDGYVVGRSKNWESEVLYWSDFENDRHEDNMEAMETAYLFGRTSSHKKFDSRPSSSHGRKLIDDRESRKRRYEFPIVYDSFSQVDRNSFSVRRNNLRHAPPRFWDPDQSHNFYGNGKSSSCSKAGNTMHSNRYDDVLDWNDELECETMNGFGSSISHRVMHADRLSIDGFHNSGNWTKKLPVTLNCLDFEERQIVVDDLNYKSRRKEIAVHQSVIKEEDEELEKPRIMEILAKMEKRKERFQQPITSKNVEDMNTRTVAASNGERKVQRPARKRKWGGN